MRLFAALTCQDFESSKTGMDTLKAFVSITDFYFINGRKEFTSGF
jgi:hypothetical protein